MLISRVHENHLNPIKLIVHLLIRCLHALIMTSPYHLGLFIIKSHLNPGTYR